MSGFDSMASLESDLTYTQKDFGNVKQGELVIIIIQQEGGVWRTVYGIKTTAIESGKQNVDYLVTLDKAKPPTAYHHHATKSRALQPLQSFQITPNLDPEFIIPELPRNHESAGVMFLLEDAMYLGVKRIGTVRAVDVNFLNLRTGDLYNHAITEIASHEKIFATRGWQLVTQNLEGKPRVVLEFVVPPAKSTSAADI